MHLTERPSERAKKEYSNEVVKTKGRTNRAKVGKKKEKGSDGAKGQMHEYMKGVEENGFCTATFGYK